MEEKCYFCGRTAEECEEVYRRSIQANYDKLIEYPKYSDIIKTTDEKIETKENSKKFLI